MSVATESEPWTSDAFAPGAIYGVDPEPRRVLSPYRVTYGDEVYDQSRFTNARSRYVFFVGGVGSGKTVGGLIRMAANVSHWNVGEMGAIVTPTMLGIKNAILPKLHRWGFFDAGWEYHGPQAEAPGLHAPNGTRVLLESASDERKIERLRGYDLAWAWLDEAARVPELAFDVLRGRLRVGEYINLFATTTPFGMNWVYDRVHEEGQRPLDDCTIVSGVPSFANPHLPIEYRRDILGDYEGHFYEQEVLAKFRRPEGLVYDWFDRDRHVAAVGDDDVPHAFDRYVYGLDWGFHPHPAAVVCIGVRATSPRLWVLSEHYETRNTIADIADALSAMMDRFGRGPVWCDPSEPRNIHALQTEGFRAKGAVTDVDPGIRLVTALQDEIRVMETCQNLINEFNSYRYADSGDPVDEFDHALDGVRYALMSDDRTSGSGPGVLAVDI